jgi:hypothetical protein
VTDAVRGRRASDVMAAEQAGQLIKHGVIIEQHGEEIDKFRTFKHEVANNVQTLMIKMVNIDKSMEALAGLSPRMAENEEAQAVHTAKCDERYEAIAEYMKDSKDDRKSIRNTVWRAAVAIIVILVGICGYFLMRFGLQPMGN